MTGLQRGIDVSRFNSTIAWSEVPAERAFALIGVTEWQTGSLDQQARANVAGCFDHGVIPGGYQRVNPIRNSPEREAAMFLGRLAHLDLLGAGRLLPALDVEPTVSGRDAEAEAGVDMKIWVRDLFTAWMDLSVGAPVLWYTSGSFYTAKYGGFTGIPSGVALWVGHWSGAYSDPKNPGNDPALAEQWAGNTSYRGDANHPALIHQYWNKGTQPGIPSLVDLDALMPGVKLTQVMQ